MKKLWTGDPVNWKLASCSVPWFHMFLVPKFLGLLVSGFLGSKVSWFQRKFLDFKVSEFHRFNFEVSKII